MYSKRVVIIQFADSESKWLSAKFPDILTGMIQPVNHVLYLNYYCSKWYFRNGMVGYSAKNKF